MTSTILLPLSRGGKICERLARTRSLLWSQSRWLATYLCERTMSPLTVLLKGLRFHHLATVATHHQIEIIMCWAVTIYVHIWGGEYKIESKWNTFLDVTPTDSFISLQFTFFPEGHGLTVVPPILTAVFNIRPSCMKGKIVSMKSWHGAFLQPLHRSQIGEPFAGFTFKLIYSKDKKKLCLWNFCFHSHKMPTESLFSDQATVCVCVNFDMLDKSLISELVLLFPDSWQAIGDFTYPNVSKLTYCVI